MLTGRPGTLASISRAVTVLDADRKAGDLGLDFQGGDGAGDTVRKLGDEADDAGSLGEGEGREVRHTRSGRDELQMVGRAVLGLGLRETVGETPLRYRFHIITGRFEPFAPEGSGRRTLSLDQVEKGGLGSVGRIRDPQFVAGLPGMGHGGRVAVAVEGRVEGDPGGGVGNGRPDGDGLGNRRFIDRIHLGAGGGKQDKREGCERDFEKLFHTASLLKVFVIQLVRVHVIQRARIRRAEDALLHLDFSHGHTGSHIRPLRKHFCFHLACILCFTIFP